MGRKKKSPFSKMLTSPELDEAKKNGDFSAILDKMDEARNSPQKPSEPPIAEDDEEVPNDPVPYPDENGNMVVISDKEENEQAQPPPTKTDGEIAFKITGLQAKLGRMAMEIDLNTKKLKEYETFIAKLTKENNELSDTAQKVPNLAARVKELEIENARLEYENSRKDSIITSLQSAPRPQIPKPRPQPNIQPHVAVQGRLRPPPGYNTNGYESWN